MMETRILRVLLSAVIGLVLVWAAAPTKVSASAIPPEDTDYVMIDDYWPMENTGPGTLIYTSQPLDPIRHGHGPASGQEGYVFDPDGDMSWGDELDRKYVQFINPIYGVWDLSAPFSQIIVSLSQDHGPYPAEALEYKIWGSNDFDASNPGAATWIAADLDTVYRKGWSDVGEGTWETCNDDYVALWDWQPGSGAGDSYRFVKLQSVWASPYDEPEVDAVKGVIGAGPGPSGPCDWQTTIVERGKVFSYTSLAIGYDGKVHLAYGGEELYYALWDGHTWQEQEVESGGVGAYCFLALDSTGKPAISYYDATNGNLKYAHWNGTSWDIQTVDSAGNVGRYTSLAFDSSGKPAISYHDVTNDNLKYARWNGTSWVKETVDSVGDVGTYTSLAFNTSTGNPAISYYDATKGELKYAEECPTWKIETVDSAGDVGSYTSLAFDSLGYPAISYHGATNGALKYAKKGVSWVTETVDSAGWVGWHTSLALDSSGKPAISYYDASNGDLKYAQWNGTSWDIETVDSNGDVGTYTSLAFDVSGNPGISYYDATNDYVKYAYSDGTSWDKETVYSIGDVGRYTSLAFDSWGNPAISYYDVRHGDLKYAHWNGSSWDIETVDSVGDVGQYTSLALDASDKPAISYYDATNGNLKYACWNGTSWDIETVDSAGDVGSYASLALDSLSNAAISYYDATNDDLKYAHFDGAVWDIETVDSAGDVGRYTSLALGSLDNPAISYYDATKGDLKYAYRCCGWTTWGIETVDSVGDVGSYTSLAFDCLYFPCLASGNPAISYYDATNGALKYAHWNGTSWDIETVDSEDWVGSHTSLAFDSCCDSCCGDIGNPAISYYDATNGDLKYAHWSGTKWDIDIVDSAGWAGRYTSLAFTSSGSPAISYGEATHHHLKYAYIPIECGPCPGPDQPSNTCPPDGAVGLSTTPTLCSSPFSHPCEEATHVASQWQITVSCRDFSSPVFDSGRDTDNLTYITIPSGKLAYCTTYCFRVRHQDDCGRWSAWSEETAFTTLCEPCPIPGTPGNPSPGNHATDVSINADLDWSDCTDTDSYDVYFGTSASPAYYGNTSSSSYSLPTLDYDTKYYWRVVAKNDCGNSTTGAVWDFTTGSEICSTPGTPSSPSPSNHATDVSINADLDWSDCINTDSYDVYFGTSPGPAYYGNTFSSSYTLPTLDYNTYYYWRIVAKNDCGNSTSGAVWDFTTQSAPSNQPPNQPINICPTPGATDVSLTPTLMSSDFSDPDAGDTHAASQWRIRVSTGDYSDPVWDSGRDTANLTCISVPSGELDYNTTYYFQVRHEDNHGNWSSYSSETFFTTHRPPRQPSNISPANGATGVSLTPTLRSSAFSDPDGDIHAASQWQIRSSTGDYSSPVYDSGASSNLTQIAIPSGILSYSTTYYWRVRHEDHLGGWSAYSSETSFTTVSAPVLQADFAVDETVVVVGQSVQFTSLSTGGVPPLSYQWDFDNNGTWDSTLENPSYAYPATGVYTVVLKVTDSAANTDTETKIDYITVHASPEADFTADETAVVVEQSVQFTSLSSGGVPPLSYQWDFDNNGTWDSTLENPSYAYPAAGTYTVVLKVTDSAANTDTETKVDYITVTAAPPPNQPPDRPSNISPADEATDVSLTPTLESSAFSDPDEGDTHAASQWQITTTPGDYSSPVFDSGVDTSNLTQMAVPSGELSYNTTYYWRVRHEDNHGDWSSWSAETRFTTEEEAVGVPFWVWVVVGLGAAVIVVAGAVFGLRRARMMMSKGLRTMFYS
jgi:PKD repeat protein